jgi:hypothetical protein
MWTYPDATDMDAYLNVNGRHRGSNAGVPRNAKSGEGRPTLGWGGECLENFVGWEGQAYIRQQRMSAAADVLGQ